MSPANRPSSPPSRFAEYPARDRNRAQVRVALALALVQRLADRSLEEVTVRDLCAATNITNGTFFNHFETKRELLVHYTQLWSLRVSLLARDTDHHDPLAAIGALYAATARNIANRPRVVLEIIAQTARMQASPAPRPIERCERLLFLEDAEDVDSLSDVGLEHILQTWIERAVAQRQLPAHTDAPAVILHAASIFFGVPLLIGRDRPQDVGPEYARALQTLWAGVRSGAR